MGRTANGNDDPGMRSALVYALSRERFKMHPIVRRNRPLLRGGECELIGIAGMEPASLQRRQCGKTTRCNELGNKDAHVLVQKETDE